MIYRIYNKRRVGGDIKLSLTVKGIETPDAEPVIIEENGEGSFIITFECGEQVQFEERGAAGTTLESGNNLELTIDEKIAKVLGITI